MERILSLSVVLVAVVALAGCRTLTPSTQSAEAATAQQNAATGDVSAPEAPPVFATASDWIDHLRRYPFDEVPRGALLAAREAKQRLEAAPPGGVGRKQLVAGNAWRPIGPRPIESEYAPVSGRVRAVAIDPSDPALGTFYVGGAHGGVWKTYNGGQSWIPLTDHEASLAIGSIALDPDDPSIVYAGTGEYGGEGPYPGAGVLRSADGGFTWTRLAATELTGARILRVALDPTPAADPLTGRTVYVASDFGLFRSLDSGATWTSVWTDHVSRVFTDVVVDPSDPAVVYAARRAPDPNTPTPPVYRSASFGAPGSWAPVPGVAAQLPQLGYGRVNLAISEGTPPVLVAILHDVRNGDDLKGIWTTVDAGQSWTRVNGHPPEFAEGSLVEDPDVAESEPNGYFGLADIIGIGDVVQGRLTSGSDNDLYMVNVSGNELSVEICADRAGSGFTPQILIYRSDGTLWGDAPLTSGPGHGPQGSQDVRMSPGWQTFEPGDYYIEVRTSDGVLTGSGDYQLSVIGASVWCWCYYDQVVWVHPTDPDIMYWGGIRLFRTTDGGRNWSQIQDHEQPDTGPNWIHQDVHAVASAPDDPRFMLWGTDGGVWATVDGGDKWIALNTNLELTQFYPGISQHPTDPDFVLGGTQDNAVIRYRGTHWQWPPATSGDGGYTAIDPTDPSGRTWYFESQHLDLRTTTDDGATAEAITSGLPRDRVPFIAPFVLDPDNPSVLLAGGGERVAEDPAVYEYRIYRSSDAGSSWSQNSEDLGEMVTAIAIAPSDSATYYVGTDDGRVWRTTTTGGSWSELTRPPLPDRPVTSIAVDPAGTLVAYVSFGGFFSGHVFRTTDGGSSWTDISSAPHSAAPLPDAPVWGVVVDPADPDTLYVASDVGIFRTVDAGVTWMTFDEDLPNVAVFDVDLNPTTGKMRAATYGRSMWELTQGNDACLDAQEIGNGTLTASTVDTTNDGGATCGLSSGSPDVWYQVEAPFTGELRVHTCGSEFDTVLSVHQVGCPADQLSQLSGGCNDDCPLELPGCGRRDSCLTVPVGAGHQYLIRVAGYDGATGDFTLTAEIRRPAPTNDDCGAVYLPQVGTYHGWTTGATGDGSASCGESDGSPDVWYRYTAECTGTLAVDLCGAEFDTVLSAHSACPGSTANQLACSDDCFGFPCGGTPSCLTLPVVQGNDTFFRVAGYEGASGEFDITLSCTPGNDSCATPWGADDGWIPFTTTLATTDGPDGDPLCSNAGSSNLTNDIWYLYEANCDGHVSVDVCDADFDTRLAVYDGAACPTARSSIACDDDGCGAPGYVQSRLEFDAVLGQSYLLRIGGYNGAVGEGSLTIATACSLIFSDGFDSGDTGEWSVVP